MGYYLGIDIGGTNVKFGIVSSDGELITKVKYPTENIVQKGNFIDNFCVALEEQLSKNKDKNITQVGIGCPGLISKDRTTTLKLQNIPSLNNINLIKILSKKFPKTTFKLENDAKVAALGEHFFASRKPDNFLMITLGTGVGGACVVNGKLFNGANGNGIEIGHMISSTGETFEFHIGKKGLVRQTLNYLAKHPYIESELREKDDITAKDIEKYAKKKDEISCKVFKRVGKYLGQCIVSSLRVLDVDTIIIGGGVADVFGIMEKKMWQEITKYLGEYYTENLTIKVAELENEAGIIGAASLNM